MIRTSAKKAETLIRTAEKVNRQAVATLQLEAKREYHQNIVDHYESPRNVGSLDKRIQMSEW